MPLGGKVHVRSAARTVAVLVSIHTVPLTQELTTYNPAFDFFFFSFFELMSIHIKAISMVATIVPVPLQGAVNVCVCVGG